MNPKNVRRRVYRVDIDLGDGTRYTVEATGDRHRVEAHAVQQARQELGKQVRFKSINVSEIDDAELPSLCQILQELLQTEAGTECVRRAAGMSWECAYDGKVDEFLKILLLDTYTAHLRSRLDRKWQAPTKRVVLSSIKGPALGRRVKVDATYRPGRDDDHDAKHDGQKCDD